ncbi:kinetochore-associated protein NSL1 homolog isoform X2 [Pipistrellus kuhlii]|uniref:kinetochore-associated protein NSL1 homolog isoform X2 n=1 Tax=Pipistrellus kuhlii TaxID=59472 RepID=UPI00174F712E|nr:kinetochore-associated protein NSL1 homolog isoform X2 [Pipistrellus kuhlii]
MAGAPELGSLSLPRAVESVAGTEDRAAGPAATPREDFRVRCTSKQAVLELMELCGRFVRQLGDALPAEVREPALRDAQWTFESAVQENVSINGQAWQEASDDCFRDSDIKELEDHFDEIIVDLATKRKQYPRKILECVIKIIKAKQEILKEYHPVVHPVDLKYDPDPEILCIYWDILLKSSVFIQRCFGQRWGVCELQINLTRSLRYFLKMQISFHSLLKILKTCNFKIYNKLQTSWHSLT